LGRAKKWFSTPKPSEWLWGSISLLFNEYQYPFNKVKWPAREADHSYLSSSEVKNEWS